MNYHQIMGLLATMVVLAGVLGSAHSDDVFAEAEKLIQQKIPCTDITEEQLESIGEYYMEQMHPGEAHVVMDRMMGGEGSESLRLAHSNMARSFYCGDSRSLSGGMMNIMMGRGGMMNMMYGYGMMGTGGWFWMSLLWILLAGLIIAFIFWILYTLLQKKR